MTQKPLTPTPQVYGVSYYLHLKGTDVAMATQTQKQQVESRHESPQVAVTKALQESRKHRHHPDCRCFQYQNLYCTPADAVWQNAINRELHALTDPATPQA